MRSLTGDEQARVLLLASIEGNSTFWAHEVKSRGAEAVVDRIIGAGYDNAKQSAERIRERIQSVSKDSLSEQLGDAFLITPTSDDWPKRLNDLAAPPFALIGLGQREMLTRIELSLGVVGTRNPTQYGTRIAMEFSAALSDREWTVISGGAFGIDTAAHRGALLVEGETIAVLGGGVKTIFPSGNDRLFAEIATHGLLLSEVLPTVPAAPHRFLIRNRLIAALSKGTLVVEAAHRSGSLRTARDAGELLRPVMAIPGPINSPSSEGCHRLINERRAELVSSVDEIMELMTPM